MDSSREPRSRRWPRRGDPIMLTAPIGATRKASSGPDSVWMTSGPSSSTKPSPRSHSAADALGMNMDKVNVYGGAIASDTLGASGIA